MCNDRRRQATGFSWLHRSFAVHFRGAGKAESLNYPRQGFEVHLQPVLYVCSRHDLQNLCRFLTGIPEGMPLVPGFSDQFAGTGLEDFLA